VGFAPEQATQVGLYLFGSSSVTAGVSGNTKIKLEEGYWQDPMAFRAKILELTAQGVFVNTTKDDSGVYAWSSAYSGLIEKCPGTATFCLGGQNWTSCAVGHDPNAPLCAYCLTGYQQNSDYECNICSSKFETFLYIFLLIIGTIGLLYIAVFAWQHVSKLAFFASWAQAQNDFGEGVKDISETFGLCEQWSMMIRIQASKSDYTPDSMRGGATQKIKIMVGLVQVMTALQGAVEIKWPQSVLDLFSNLQIFNFNIADILQLNCLDDNFSFRTWFFLVIFGPVFILGSGKAVEQFYIRWYMPSRLSDRLGKGEYKEKEKGAKELYVRFVLVTLFLVYPQVVQVICKMLRPCHKMIDGKEWLHADYTVDCLDGAHNFFYIPLALIAVGVYIFGVPFYMFWSLYKERKFLYHETPPHSDGSFFSEADARWYSWNDDLLPTLGFLYYSYEPNYYWWEVAEMLRKLFFSGIIVFIQPGSPSQLVAGLLVALFFAVYSAYAEPYISDSDDITALIAHVQIFMVIFCALLIRADVSSSEGYDEDTFGALIILCILTPVVLCIYLILLALFLPPWESWRYDVERRRQMGIKAISLFEYMKRVWVQNEEESFHEDEKAIVYINERVTKKMAFCRRAIKTFRESSEKAGFLLTHVLRAFSRFDVLLERLGKMENQDHTDKLHKLFEFALDKLIVLFESFAQGDMQISDIHDLMDRLFVMETAALGSAKAAEDSKNYSEKMRENREKLLQAMLGDEESEEYRILHGTSGKPEEKSGAKSPKVANSGSRISTNYSKQGKGSRNVADADTQVTTNQPEEGEKSNDETKYSKPDLPLIQGEDVQLAGAHGEKTMSDNGIEDDDEQGSTMQDLMKEPEAVVELTRLLMQCKKLRRRLVESLTRKRRIIEGSIRSARVLRKISVGIKDALSPRQKRDIERLRNKTRATTLEKKVGHGAKVSSPFLARGKGPEGGERKQHGKKVVVAVGSRAEAEGIEMSDISVAVNPLFLSRVEADKEAK
jgi:hypothetical protein